MPSSLQVQVYDDQVMLYSVEGECPMVLGRQKTPDEPWLSSTSQGCRVVIAPFDDIGVSRELARLQALSPTCWRLHNASRTITIRLQDGTEIRPGNAADVPMPLHLSMGKRWVRITLPNNESSSISGKTEKTPAPKSFQDLKQRFPALPKLARHEANSLEIIKWLQTVMNVLQSASTAGEFFEHAVHGVVDMAGLEVACVLMREEGAWQIRAVHRRSSHDEGPIWHPSDQILRRVLIEKKTFWLTPEEHLQESQSARVLDAAGAAPILDVQGRVLGVLYGERRLEIHGTKVRLGELEATIIELLAGSVAAGLARIAQEKAALSARVQFEQFFTAELAMELASQPNMLEGREADVTILFCDIRGFSRISDRIGPARTVQWASAVLQTLSECVLATQGVLVNYIGDALMAMWGAPRIQADHARRACNAALAMLDSLEGLQAHWQDTIGEPLAIGIGINSGRSCVGNIGSLRKFMYGPSGTPVNLASRVEGATKYLRLPLLITGTTRQQLDSSFCLRRLCDVRVVNIPDPVELFELAAPGQPGWEALKTGYEQALLEFESQELRLAARTLAAVLADHPNDGPSLLLLARAVNALVHNGFERIWELPGK
jgi:adenylate cyclase